MLLQRKIQRERDALVQKRRTAQQKLAILQKLHADVQATQQKEAKQAQQNVKFVRQAQGKIAEYQGHIEKLQRKLEKNGFTQEVSLPSPVQHLREPGCTVLCVVLLVPSCSADWLCEA